MKEERELLVLIIQKAKTEKNPEKQEISQAYLPQNRYSTQFSTSESEDKKPEDLKKPKRRNIKTYTNSKEKQIDIPTSD